MKPLSLAELQINAVMMHHEGGTKFYQTTWLMSKRHNQFMLINRWGKTSYELSGGGANQTYDANSYNSVCRKMKSIIDAKRKRGYELYGAGQIAYTDESMILTPEWANKKVNLIMNIGVRKLFEEGDVVVREFFADCGIENLDDFHEFILGREGVEPTPESEIEVTQAPKVRSAAWGSW